MPAEEPVIQNIYILKNLIRSLKINTSYYEVLIIYVYFAYV